MNQNGQRHRDRLDTPVMTGSTEQVKIDVGSDRQRHHIMPISYV